MTRITRQHGYILLPVVILLTLVATVAFMLNNESALDSGITASNHEVKQAELIAAAGLAHATWGAQNSGCAGDMGMASVPFGQAGSGSYTATATTTGGATTAYPNLAADQDAWFRSDDITVNNGGVVSSHLRRESGNLEYVVVRFDLSTLPAGSQINSATARFYVMATKGHPQGPVQVHRVTADWTETGATWETMSDKFDSTLLNTIPAQPAAGDVWVEVNLTAQVQAWVNGGEANYGIMLIPTGEGTHAEYISREGAANQQPRLDVIVGTGPASPLTITAIGTLTGSPSPSNDITRTLTRTDVPAYQPPGTVTLQLGTDPGADTVLDDFYPRNYGGADFVQLNGDPSWLQRPLFRFDLVGIPARASVISARLELRMRSLNTPGTATVHRVTRSWVEGTKSGTGTADGATWATYDGSNNWTSVGGDFNAAVVAETAINSTDTWVSWEIAPLVEQWLAGEPNDGLLIQADAALREAEFFTKEDVDATVHPKLTITYACECGSACLAPQGSGTVLMVVVNPSTLVPIDAYKKALFESWGYTVAVVGESDNQATYDAAIAAADVVFISETVNASQVGNKLKDAPIGVVSQDGSYNSALGFASGNAWTVDQTINVTDTSHYITALFPARPLDIYLAGMEQLTVSGAGAPGLRMLADTGGAGSLVVLDTGAMGTGGTPLTGRRVMLPLGRDVSINWDYLNNNGRLIVQRALQWGTGNTGGPATKLLLVVADPGSLTAQEVAKKSLIESWGYKVNLIDESDSPTNFDAAIAANDVAYIPQDINSTNLGTKLANASIGVVNEEGEQVDELGFSGDKIFKNNHEIDVVDNSHYITKPFATGFLTFVSSDQSVHMLNGQIAPGLQTLGQTFNVGSQYKPSLATLDTGDALSGGGSAAGRRVQLPWGGGTFDINLLTDDGRTIMRRAIEWGAGADIISMLIGHWKLDDASGLIAADSSDNGNDGTRTDDPVWTTGILAGALDFDGSNDRVLVPDAPSLDITNTITLAAWVKPNATGTEYVIRKALFDSTDGYELSLSTTGKVFFRLNQASNANTYHIDSTTSYPTDGTTWMHIAATYDGAVMRLYLDGVEEATLNAATSIATNDTDLSIGAQVDGSRGIDGVIDDVRLYGNALSAAEIVDLATPPPPVPIAHWKLDETSGTMAVDSVGGHDGTLSINGPTWVAGQLDGALDFDGSNDYIDLTSDAELDDVFVGGATVMAWIEPAGWGGNGYGRIFDKSSSPSSTGDGWAIRLNTDNGGLNFGQGFASSRGWWRIPNSSISLGTWQHIAVAYDASSTANDPIVYLNGSPVLVTKVDTPSGTVRSDAAINLRLGNHASGTSNGFDGKIDDARIYDRILSAAEIADLVSGGGGGGPGPGSCDGTFRDEFSLQQYDQNNGTLSWATVWEETGETTDPNGGDIYIANDTSNYQLVVQDDGQTVWREADLSGAGSATLSFDYRRENLSGSGDYVAVEVSYNGGSNWAELDRFTGTATDAAYTSTSYVLDAGSLSANTRIRFLTPGNGMGNTNMVWFDNIQIQCSP